MDGLGEVVPRDDALVAEVIDAGTNAFLDGGHNHLCKVACIGGRSNLVEDDTELGTLLAQSEHGLHEVVAEGGVEPSRADNHGSAAKLLNTQFSRQFGVSINAIGAWGIGFHIGRVLGAVEHIVGADLYYPSSALLDGGGQIGRCYGVERGAEFLVGLGLVDGGIGRAVDDAIYLVFLNELFNGQLVGDVEFADVGVEPLVFAMFFFEQLNLVAKLAVTACYQNFHIALRVLFFVI